MDESDEVIDMTASMLERMRIELEKQMIDQLTRKAHGTYQTRAHLLLHFANICSCVAQENFIRVIGKGLTHDQQTS